MQAIAERGGYVLVQLQDRDEAKPLALVPAVVVNTRRGTVSAPSGVDTILAHGYWTPFEGDPVPVLALVSSAITAAAFDPTKHPRSPSGSESGGEFVSISGNKAKVTTVLPNGEQQVTFRPATNQEKSAARKAEREQPHHLTKVGVGWYANADGTWGVIGDDPGYAVTKEAAGGEGMGAGLPTQREWQVVHSPEGGLRESYEGGQQVQWVNSLKEGREVIKKRVGQLTAAGRFDPTKHPRYPKGVREGGRFRPGDMISGMSVVGNHPVEGEVVGENRFGPIISNEAGDQITVKAETAEFTGDSGLEPSEHELEGTPAWLQSEAKTADEAYYKATRPREAVATARGWLEENGYEEEARGNSIQVVQAMQDHYPDGYEFFLSINDLHKEDFRRNYMQDGDYTDERKATHNGIRAAYLSTARLPENGEAPEALFMAGGSGAGKSSIVGKQGPDGNFHGGTIDAPEGAVYVNPDEIKELFPETDALKAADDPRWAALSHEESSDVAATLRGDAEKAGFPMVIDGTGDAAGPSEQFPEGKFMGKVRDAEKAGYKTKIVFVDIPVEEAIRRADIRAQETGRKISQQQIRDIHRNVTARHLEWRDAAADWEVWANDDAESGGRRLIAKRVAGGPIEILDAERYAQMERKAA